MNRACSCRVKYFFTRYNTSGDGIHLQKGYISAHTYAPHTHAMGGYGIHLQGNISAEVLALVKRIQFCTNTPINRLHIHRVTFLLKEGLE